MFTFAGFDLEYQPETYWPEGFEPFVPEQNAPPVHRLDEGGEVYEDAAGHWHYVTFPDEVVIATFGDVSPIYLCAWHDREEIQLRYVMIDDADMQATPPYLTPGIVKTAEPLGFDELIYLLDFTVLDEGEDFPPALGMIAWLWGIDEDEADTRIDRLFIINSAPKIHSVLYPKLTALYQAIGASYVQTGEFFDIVPLVEILAEHADELELE